MASELVLPERGRAPSRNFLFGQDDDNLILKPAAPRRQFEDGL